jgi:drug/metabolite transporter (DMT)-like permease
MQSRLSANRDNVALILLAAIWGASYLFIRVAVPALGPFGLAFARVLVGGAGLLIWVRVINSGEIPRLGRSFFILAAINSLVPFVLINFAELHITASLAAILNATTPLFASIVVLTMNRQRPGPHLLAGLAMGITGVLILVGWSPVPLTTTVVLAIIAMLVASFGYASAGVFAKQKLSDHPAPSLALGQQLSASLLLFPLATGSVAVGSTDPVPAIKVMLAVLALGLLCTSVAYVLYFHLIAAVGPVRTSTVTFLIPVFGIFWSWLFLDEQIRPTMLIGLAVILASVRLVNRPA